MHQLLIAYLALAVSGSILFLKAVPALQILLKYGKTAQSGHSGPKSPLEQFASRLAQLTVPKAWFTHYYVLFAVLTWPQWFFRKSEGFGLFELILAMFTFQATRRTVESFTVTKFGTKLRIHVSHYAAGLFYYVGLAGNTWLAISGGTSGGQPSGIPSGKPSNLPVKAPFWPSALAIATFLAASVDQLQNHRHLAALVKYSVPTRGLFRYFASAHYFDEIVIYTAATALSYFGNNSVVFWNFAALLVFAVTNLSVSAVDTRNYYLQKFDDYQVPWAILPGL